MVTQRSVFWWMLALLLCKGAILGSELWPAWYAKYEPSLDFRIVYSIAGMAVDAGGNTLITGTASTNAGITWNVAMIAKFNPAGLPQWLSIFRPPMFETFAPVGIATDTLGNCYVAGTAISNYHRVALLLKYSPQGNQLWSVRDEAPSGSNVDVAQMAISPRDDEIFMCGRESAAGASLNMLVLKFDSGGRRLWRATYNAPDNSSDAAEAIVALPDGGVVVGGNSIAIATRKDYLTLRYDAAGNALWSARHNTNSASTDTLTAMAGDSAGNIYVTGHSTDSGGDTDIVTIKYDPHGTELWTTRYAGTNGAADVATALAVDPDANVYLTGRSGPAILTLKYDANGNELWQQHYQGALGGDFPIAIALDSSQTVYVAGTSPRDLGFGRSAADVAVLLAYGPDGQPIASKRHVPCRTGSVGATGLAMYHTGELFLAGADFVIKYADVLPPDLRMEAFRIGSQGFGFTVFGEPGHCYNILSTSKLPEWEPSSLRFIMKGVREDVLWTPVVGQGARDFFQARRVE